MGEFLAALREEVDPTVILGTVVVLGMVMVFTDASWSIVVAAGIAFGLTAVINALDAVSGGPSLGASATVFALGALVGLWLTVTESSYFMGAMTLLLAWLALDTFHKAAHGIEPTEPDPSGFDEMGAGEAGRVMYRAGKVQRALDDSPASLSASELVTRTDLSEAEVREALTMLEDADAVLEERERYELDRAQPGPVRSTARRLARPFSLFTPNR
ncbi:hypothetical protein [Halalkalicoccus jeotgali]|uniref:Uncharacterized protein n=1 Tax=Halalkalicoccus jeotgali (strain DSM 18796 / CECT 7217 / JCM 14584 / KCTC 4019 / B3) TaxID=795797 RepID=D8J5E9_HALJB|nr:hypothetical protein [Halalkalicoccus jeotgali]ADJ15645.1 hypothetical protein HacjB3_11310 [Halalkalicoccus jeotgali B3]ELY36585.1 hypothetical protein C497_11338 [Halalkalicoccus jeotgali B3]